MTACTPPSPSALRPLLAAAALAVCAATAPAAPLGIDYELVAQPVAPEPSEFWSALARGSDGRLYGTSVWGGSGEQGTVFRLEEDGSLTVLHSFAADGSEGSHPNIGLTPGADGWLYGAVLSGGTGQLGTIYRISTTGEFAVLHQFGKGVDHGIGAPGFALVQAADGRFYGGANFTPRQAGGHGALYRMDPVTFEVALVHVFRDDGDGMTPAALAAGPQGTLFGTTQNHDRAVAGTVFVLRPGQPLRTLHTFDTAIDGCAPIGPIAVGDDGAVYGATFSCGAGGQGTLFRAAADGSRFDVLHAFAVEDPLGFQALGGLVRDDAGRLFGTTSAGGAKGGGTLFTITPAGTATLLHKFDASNGDGWHPAAAPTPLPEGVLYGTTTSGGAGSGTIYRAQRR
jgi:uncharacterized repeat protein (TIGR03803 family)